MGFFTTHPSPLGLLTLCSDGISLTGLWITNPPAGLEEKGDLPIFDTAKNWLDSYFRGEKPSAELLSLSPAGTAFQRLVWEILLTIPCGETRTYGSIAAEAARRLGKEKMSAQAVGGAVGRNPICIVIPCHRVLGAGGALTGFRDGLDKKNLAAAP